MLHNLIVLIHSAVEPQIWYMEVGVNTLYINRTMIFNYSLSLLHYCLSLQQRCVGFSNSAGVMLSKNGNGSPINGKVIGRICLIIRSHHAKFTDMLGTEYCFSSVFFLCAWP